MKISKKPSREQDKAFNQVKKYLKTDREMFAMMLTYMGMMSMMLDFLADTYGTSEKMKELPERTKYAMAQAIHHYKTLGMVIRGEIKPEELGLRCLPIEDDAWENPDKISDRMVLVVKELYMQLKEEGKL